MQETLEVQMERGRRIEAKPVATRSLDSLVVSNRRCANAILAGAVIGKGRAKEAMVYMAIFTAPCLLCHWQKYSIRGRIRAQQPFAAKQCAWYESMKENVP